MKKILISLLIIINIIVISRLSFLSIYKKDYYNEILEAKSNIILEGMTAPRGRIIDSKGIILVDNIGVKSIIYNKLNINTNKELEIASKLSKTLELEYIINDYDLRYYYYQLNKEKVDKNTPNSVIKSFNERKINAKELLDIRLDSISIEELSRIDSKAAYFYFLMNNGYIHQDKIIKTNISADEYILINSLNLEGIRTDITWERIYPYENTLRDVLGSVSSYEQGLTLELKDEYLAKGYKLNDRVGLNNLEYIYDEYLKGEKAKYKIENNRLNKISDYRRGKDIVLSIDIALQLEIENILEEEMIKAKAGANTKHFNESFVIVSNPNDGSVISLVGKKINNDSTFIDYSYYNIMNSYTVGSVVKGASISVGYKNDLINESTSVVDSCVQLFSQRAKCSWASLGRVNDIRALQWSSNYFQYLIAVRLTGNNPRGNLVMNANKEHFEEYRNVFKSFGLGALTGIDLSNESPGMKGVTISDDLLLNMTIGQYDTYTPISLSQYINTVATGSRKKMHLVKEILNPDGSIYKSIDETILNELPITDNHLERIRLGFREVNRAGTGGGHTNRRFTSAGKTGTAEAFLDTNMDGVVDTQTISSTYVMYAPFENPEVSITIVSPHISYRGSNRSRYNYPINSRVIRRVSELVV